MNDIISHIADRVYRPESWLQRAKNLFAALALSLALCAMTCSCSLPGLGGANGSQPSTPSPGTRSTSGVTVAFATCMRSHGVPNFPNPTNNGPELGPGSGIDPNSPQFQQALQACKSLAPPSWVSSGPSSSGP